MGAGRSRQPDAGAGRAVGRWRGARRLDARAGQKGVDLGAGVGRRVKELHAHAQILGGGGRHDLPRDLDRGFVTRQREGEIDHRAHRQWNGVLEAQPAPGQIAGAPKVALRSGRLLHPHLDRDPRSSPTFLGGSGHAPTLSRGVTLPQGAALQTPSSTCMNAGMSRRRILVSGGSGFLGSHLCERLLKEGNEVVCLDNFFTGSRANVEHLLDDHRFELMRHDVTVPLTVEVDEVYHLACPASPIHYQRNPVQTIRTAVEGTLNMLDLAREVKARVLIASTSEVYGDPIEHPQRESYWGNVNPIR